MRLTFALLLLVTGCSGTASDPTDASDDHKVGTPLDGGDGARDTSSGDGSPFGDATYSDAPTTCTMQDASAPPFDCAQAHNGQNQPLPFKYICPNYADSGMWPSGTVGVDCIDELDTATTSLWCCK